MTGDGCPPPESRPPRRGDKRAAPPLPPGRHRPGSPRPPDPAATAGRRDAGAAARPDAVAAPPASIGRNRNLAGRGPARLVDSEPGGPFRVGDQSHRRVQPPNHLGRSRGVGSVGDEHLQGTRVLLGQHRVEGRLGVADWNDNRYRRKGSCGGGGGTSVGFPLREGYHPRVRNSEALRGGGAVASADGAEAGVEGRPEVGRDAGVDGCAGDGAEGAGA